MKKECGKKKFIYLFFCLLLNEVYVFSVAKKKKNHYYFSFSSFSSRELDQAECCVFHDLESQDGFLDIISDDVAAEDGSEDAEGKQALSFHEFEGHTLVDEQGGFPTIVNNEIGPMKIYDTRSSRFSLSSHGGQQRFLS
jgi:hypothetical protein